MGGDPTDEPFEARLARLIGSRSHAEVARRAGISLSGLEKLLAGGVRSPKAETLAGLARALGVRPQFLRYAQGEPELILDLDGLLEATRAFLEREVERRLTERLDDLVESETDWLALRAELRQRRSGRRRGQVSR